MGKFIIMQQHGLQDRSTQETVMPEFLDSVSMMNLHIAAVNASLNSSSIPAEEWPTEILFFDEIFETVDEAELFLQTKASKSVVAACKTTKGPVGTRDAESPSWVFICLNLPSKRN